MLIDEFFNLFLEELKSSEKMREYYRFHEDIKKLPFRQAYFCQRLQYVFDYIQRIINNTSAQATSQFRIWDCGCGFGTTQIFLALNGIPSFGNTLEFYFKEIPMRLDFWSKYGNMDLLKISYDDLFEMKIPPDSQDIIIVQDTLHHLEPLQEALAIFYKSLRPGGTLIAIEENGNNIIQRVKLYLQRGSQRIIQYYDEGLGRMVTMGNENIREYTRWRSEFNKAGFQIEDDNLRYIRLFPPVYYRRQAAEDIIAKEQVLWQRYPLLREYFFFGINFTAKKSGQI